MDSSGKGKRVVFIATTFLALAFVIIGAPGILLSTQNGQFTVGSGCTAYVNAWNYWQNCPNGFSTSTQIQDLQTDQYLKDRLRTVAAFEILSIAFCIIALLLGIVGTIKEESSKVIRLLAILVSAIASVTLLISWGLVTTLLQQWQYRWGFALLVTSFVVELISTIAAALFL